MSLLQASALGFTYQLLDPLFRQVTFDLEPGDRVALVGPNGAGKTTLLRLLAGDLTPGEGRVVRRGGLRVAATPQVPQPEPGETLRTWLNEPELTGLERVLHGLGLGADRFHLPLASLSSGQRNTAYLARCLASGADLLLLDEPTNHLDIAARRWLARHLDLHRGACVAVSHDERFLDAYATRVFELVRGAFHDYAGGYRFYREQREAQREAGQAAYERQQQRRAALDRAAGRRTRLAASMRVAPAGQRDTRGAAPHYERKAGKVARTARLLRERLDAEPAADKPWEEPPIPALTFRGVPRCPDPCFELLAVSKSYGARRVLANLTVQGRRGQRLGLCGPNGSGKTTLLRLLLGQERPDAGEVKVAPQVRFGYYAQEADTLDPRRSAVDNCAGVCADREWIRTLLGCLKLPRVLAGQPVGALSPGERAKAALARVLVEGGNVLLLDEPTNHLELEAQHALASTLRAYPGAMVLVSHDRGFLERCTDQVLELDPRGPGLGRDQG